MCRPTALLAALTCLVLGVAGCGTERAPAGAAATASAQPTPAAPTTVPGDAASPSGAEGAPGGATTGRPAPARPYAVGLRTLRWSRGADRPLPTTVFYPATGAAGGAPRTGAPAASGRFPVLVFSHGLGAAPADYQPLLARWAAAGFVVAAPAYPRTSRGTGRIDVADVLNQPADASYVLTRLLALHTEPGDPLRGRMDITRVGAAGHSAGGVTTIGLFTVARDQRLTGGVVLAGSALGVGTAFSGHEVPLLYVHGARDNVVSYAAGKAAYDATPWPKALLTLPDMGHGEALRGGGPAFTVVADTTAEFLRWALYGDARARDRLPQTAGRGGLATLDDRL
ncbi:MAG TPA: chlorophyllase [Pilimelia sp.]|nr:chlorophyllase [Pilimelia sp.]